MDARELKRAQEDLGSWVVVDDADFCEDIPLGMTAKIVNVFSDDPEDDYAPTIWQIWQPELDVYVEILAGSLVLLPRL